MRIAGYASVFGVADAGGDVVRAGAFARAVGGTVPGGVPSTCKKLAARPEKHGRHDSKISISGRS